MEDKWRRVVDMKKKSTKMEQKGGEKKKGKNIIIKKIGPQKKEKKLVNFLSMFPLSSKFGRRKTLFCHINF